MALFTVRSPFQSTAWLGIADGYGADNPCQANSDRYWHKSGYYQARAFDIAVASGGGGGTVYARLVNGTGLIAGVQARNVYYQDG
ncbi:MAG: hypothetical protein OXG27_14595 [Chloroflexi bacterium]|nr:hypothetical protein [Chloroflexota bacterium]